MGVIDPTAPSVTHLGRAVVASGLLERAPIARGFFARARALFGACLRSAPAAVHGASADLVVGVSGRAAPQKTAGARSRAQVCAMVKARAAAVHAARARTITGILARVPLTPEEVVGFYEGTAKRVRQRLKSVAGALPIQYANLPFAEPTGVPWAMARVVFDEPEDPGLGAGGVVYIVPGALEVALRVPLQSGKKAALVLADTLAAALELQEINGVIYRAAESPRARDVGTDEFEVVLRVPFRATDEDPEPAAPGAPTGDTFADAEEQIRKRFRTALPDVTASYDNLPTNTGAQWVRIEVHSTQSFNVDGLRRTVGVMEAEIHVPVHTGEKAALRMADRIVEQFRMVDTGGVKFSVPTVPAARKGFGEWIQPVICPWSCDHA